MTAEACGHSTRETEEALAWEMIHDVAGAFTGPEDHYMLSLDQITSDLYETAKEFAKNVESVSTDEAEAFAGDVMLRHAVLLIGEEAVRARYPLPPEEPEPERFNDGSFTSLVDMEEVREELDRYSLNPDQVMLNILGWCQAAQHVFAKEFRARFGDGD